jgi:nitroreductase
MSNQVIECLNAHCSIRRYRPDPIPEETVRALIGAGTRAATAGNLQLYSFLVIDDAEKIALFRANGGRIPGPPPLAIMALVDLYRIKRWLEVNQARPPVLHRPIYFMLGLWDALIALQNIVVAAESLGLGTCYYGASVSFDIQQHFGAPELVFPAGMVCVGYPDQEPRSSVRLPLEAVMHKNEYQRFDDATIRRLYTEREAIWESVSEERKAALRAEGIHNIPQAIAVQRFTDEITRQRSRGIIDNLRRAGFTFEEQQGGDE